MIGYLELGLAAVSAGIFMYGLTKSPNAPIAACAGGFTLAIDTFIFLALHLPK